MPYANGQYFPDFDEEFSSAESATPQMKVQGNIDLTTRPKVKNPDGSISTVRSMSFGTDDGEVLIPTVARDGSGILSNEDAIKQYKDTGEHLGIFNTPEEADRYGEMLHNSQADIYTKPSTVSIDDIPHHDWVENLGKGIVNALALPGDVLSGKVQPNSPQEIERAMDLAGLMVGGPAPVASKLADGTLGSFAGVKSKMLDKNALAEAQVMKSNGASADDVWSKTGFFQGADTRWRYEIPDNNAQLKMDNFVDAGNNSIRPKNPLNDVDMTKMSTLQQINHLTDAEVHQPLSNIIDHPELFKAYPFLKDVRVQNMPDSMKSKALAFVDSNGTIHMSPMEPDLAKSVLLHEVQHVIQRHEGFARGGNAKSFESPNLPKAQKIYDDAIANGADPNSPNMVKAKKIIDDNRAQAYQSYLRLAGEVESRNVEARMDFSDILRKRLSPQMTEDFAPNEQMVRFYNE